MSDERWILRRGRRDPLVYPFASQEAAEDFALDHGMIDWRPERHDDPEKEHEAICARCNEVWPCQHVRLDYQATLILDAAKRRCARCGKGVTGYAIHIKGAGELGEDVVYHGRKGACRNLAYRELRRLGHVEQIERLDREDAAHERQRAWHKAVRAATGRGLPDKEAWAFADAQLGITRRSA